MRKRGRFWRMAVANGYRWIGGVFDHFLRMVAVVALFGLPLVIIAIHHGHHLWLLTISVAVVLAVALAEGAYEVWDEADRQLKATRGELEQESSRGSLADHLSELADEVAVLEVEVKQIAPGDDDHAFNDVTGSYNYVYERAVSRLRLDAPQWLSYWREDPPDWDDDAPPTAESMARLFVFAEAQLRHMSRELRRGDG